MLVLCIHFGLTHARSLVGDINLLIAVYEELKGEELQEQCEQLHVQLRFEVGV